MEDKRIFIDTSGFRALFDASDDFHKQAKDLWQKLLVNETQLVTNNYILDETYTLFRSQLGKKEAILLRDNLSESPLSITIVWITPGDEKLAWEYFEKLPGRGVSFTDCISFSVMRRLLLKTAFAFDEDFIKAGFTVAP